MHEGLGWLKASVQSLQVSGWQPFHHAVQWVNKSVSSSTMAGKLTPARRGDCTSPYDAVQLRFTRMHGSAIRCVRNHDQSIWKNVKFDPRKYKMAKVFKRRPEYTITSRSWVVVQNPSKIGSPNFAGEIGEVFLLTHTQSIIQIDSFISPTDHKYGRIWNISGSKRVVSRPDVPFWSIVDDKSCLGVQIPPKLILGTIQCKTYYRERELSVNRTLMELRCWNFTVI